MTKDSEGQLVRIVTPINGAAEGTKVTMPDGAEVPDITAIEFGRIDCWAKVTATITLDLGSCEIHAHPLLSEETLRASAEALGYSLEREGPDRFSEAVKAWEAVFREPLPPSPEWPPRIPIRWQFLGILRTLRDDLRGCLRRA